MRLTNVYWDSGIGILKQRLLESLSENSLETNYQMKPYEACQCIKNMPTMEIGWKLCDKRSTMRRMSRKENTVKTIISLGQSQMGKGNVTRRQRQRDQKTEIYHSREKGIQGKVKGGQARKWEGGTRVENYA